MPTQPYAPEQALTILRATPPRIAVTTAGLTPAQCHASPAPGEWSINDILAHLRSCGTVWGTSITRILTEDNPTICAISPRTWIKKSGYLEQEFHPALHAFATQRTALLTQFESLSPEGWSRTATIRAVGHPYTRTVLDFAERMATHERDHVRDIEAIATALRS